MRVDKRKYVAEGAFVFRAIRDEPLILVAHAESIRGAKLIASALNLYRPKVRVRKRAEKQQATRGLGR